MLKGKIQKYVLEHLKVIEDTFTEGFIDQLTACGNIIRDKINSGGKVFVCGNGGSAADAQHFAAELVGQFEDTRKPLPAIALTTDTSIITATANDFDYTSIFVRQLRALASPRDVLIGISTSGRSKNILSALEYSTRLPMFTVLLTGKDCEFSDCSMRLNVQSNSTARIQEAHILALHVLTSIIESGFIPVKWG